MFKQGDKIFWNRKNKKVIVNFFAIESDTRVIIQYKIKREIKRKSVAKSSISPIIEQPPLNDAPVESYEGWTSPLQLKKKEAGRPRLNKIWNRKCDMVLSRFLTKEVRGNGLCMLWAINEVSGQRITPEHLMEWAIRKDSSGESGYTIDPRTNEVKQMSLVDELKPPLDNLSEAWWPIFTKHLKCRFIILGCRMQTRGTKTSHTYTVEEYSADGYENTYFLFNGTHYWPLKNLALIQESEVEEIKTIWENKTYTNVQ